MDYNATAYVSLSEVHVAIAVSDPLEAQATLSV